MPIKLAKGLVRASGLFDQEELGKIREGIMTVTKVREFEGRQHVTFIAREKNVEEIALYTEHGISIQREPEELRGA